MLDGVDWINGMPGFADPPKFDFPSKMAVENASAIHAYVIDQAWKAYNEEYEQADSKREHD